ncbi:ROK family protein [Kribbella jiaozuonensis]|nr:ROK family protein [Kribbella jiaozuonensis]
MVTSEHEGFEQHLQKVLPDKPKPSEKVSQQVLGAVLQELAIAAPDGRLRNELLRRVGPGDGSKYSAATLSKALAALEKAHLITKRAVYSGPGAGGRPPERYLLGSNLWAMVGVHISISQNQQHTVTCTIRDLSAQLIQSRNMRLTEDTESAQIALQIGDFVKQMIGQWQAGRTEARILGVGIEVPGHVHRGLVMEAPHSGWQHAAPLAIDIGEALDHELSVVLDNDVNLIALREMYRRDRRSRPQDGAVVAVFDEGVGAGLVVGGRVYRGHRGGAGEPGHNPVFVDAGEPRLPRAAAVESATAGGYPTFADPCNCKKLSHIDCYAIPQRIAGELGYPLAEFARLAGEPAYDGVNLTPAGRAFWTAGSALGHGIVSLIHAQNPGWLLLLLPRALADVELGTEWYKQTAAAMYRQAIETVVDEEAFSSAASDARRGAPRLEVRSTAGDPDGGPEKAARNAAIRVLDDFIAHALKQDECIPEQPDDLIPSVPAGLDERQLAKERQLALTKELREILKYHDPEQLLGSDPLADQYFTEEHALLRLVMDQTLNKKAVQDLWHEAFRPSRLLGDQGKLSEFTRELETLQRRWISGRIAPVGR